MDIEKSFLELLYSDELDIRNRMIVVERLILSMLEDYLQRQGKALSLEYTRFCDAYVIDGFDSFHGDVAIEIKYTRRGIYTTSEIYRTIVRLTGAVANLHNILVIVVGPELDTKTSLNMRNIQAHYGFNIVLWGNAELIDLFKRRFNYNLIN